MTNLIMVYGSGVVDGEGECEDNIWNEQLLQLSSGDSAIVDFAITLATLIISA